MRKICFYHAGCPDGFGAAWAVWRAWGDAGQFRPLGHEDVLDADQFKDDIVAFVDIAPSNRSAQELSRQASKLIVLDHHLSSRNRFEAEPRLLAELDASGHRIHFDLDHSGAVLAWQHFHPHDPVPDLLRYVEDQDLWAWKLPRSEQVNAAIGSRERSFEVWNRLSLTPMEELASEGVPLVRTREVEVERSLRSAHAVQIGDQQVEAVNSTAHRSAIGHVLSERAQFGLSWGLVYRVVGQRVDATLYSIGELDVAAVAVGYGGGGHRNAAGFSVPLDRWLSEFLPPATAAE